MTFENTPWSAGAVEAIVYLSEQRSADKLFRRAGWSHLMLNHFALIMVWFVIICFALSFIYLLTPDCLTHYIRLSVVQAGGAEPPDVKSLCTFQERGLCPGVSDAMTAIPVCLDLYFFTRSIPFNYILNFYRHQSRR